MSVFDDLVASNLPDDPYFSRALKAYFPKDPEEKIWPRRLPASTQARDYPTFLANTVVNRTGATFVNFLAAEAAATAADVVRAYTLAREIFDLEPLWDQIDAPQTTWPQKLTLSSSTPSGNLIPPRLRRHPNPEAVGHSQREECCAVVIDITERLGEKELARSNAELEQFAYVASHDLQEPLRMVASYVSFSRRATKTGWTSDAHEFIAYAVDGATRMKQMIADLLAYSRVGRQGKEFVPVACETALSQACADLRASITEAAAEVTHGPLPTVVGNAGQLTHLFQNLIGNAIKFRGQEPRGSMFPPC